MPTNYKGYNLADQESMKIAVDILVRVQLGEFVDKLKHEQELKAQAEQMTKDADARVKKAREDGLAEGRATVPAAPTPNGTIDPNPDRTKYELNGVSVTVPTKDGTVNYNYKLKN